MGVRRPLGSLHGSETGIGAYQQPGACTDRLIEPPWGRALGLGLWTNPTLPLGQGPWTDPWV